MFESLDIFSKKYPQTHMKIRQTLRVGYFLPRSVPLFGNNNLEQYAVFFSDIKNFYARFTLTLIDIITFAIYSKKFYAFSLLMARDRNILLRNGTLLGIEGRINRSEIDIGLPPIVMREDNQTVEFCDSGKLSSATFFIVKPRYKLQSDGIFLTFTTSL